jgi:hypothetical protein
MQPLFSTRRQIMTKSDNPSEHEIALIVGGGPGISASCARLFTANGMSRHRR